MKPKGILVYEIMIKLKLTVYVSFNLTIKGPSFKTTYVKCLLGEHNNLVRLFLSLPLHYLQLLYSLALRL